MVKNDDSIKIKELLEIIKHKVDLLEAGRSGQFATTQLIKDQLSVMNQKMDDMKESLDSNTASVIEIENILKSYADSYKENQRNIERVDTRLSNVEDNLGIEPHPDLKVPHFAE